MIMSATTACQSVDRMHLQLGKYPSRFRPSGGPWGPALILAPVTGLTLYGIDLNPEPLESFGTQTARRDHEQSPGGNGQVKLIPGTQVGL